jgi:hypothetical protein
MAIRDRIMSSNMRQPFREDVLRPMPVPMPMPILPPAPRQPLPLPMLPPVMPPRREDFLSIQRLDDLIVRPSPVGPSIPFVPSQDLPLPPGPILPPRGRPIPPISIGGIVGGKPMLKVPGGGGINYGIPDSFTPLPGSANERESIIPPPIDLRPPRPLQPIDIPAPVLPDPRDTIGKPLPPIPLEDFGLGPGRRIPPMATPADFIPRNDKTTGYDELQEKIGGSRLRFPPPQDVPPIPLEDFGLGPGIRPTEIRDEQGNIIVGSGGVTPPNIPDTTPPPVVDPVVITPPIAPPPVVDPVVITPPIAPPPVVTPEPIITETTPTIDPVTESAPTTPAAVATDVGAVPTTTIPQDVRGQVDPVLAQQDTVEMQTDPLLRALYFGTADQPGFINQLQQATANLIGSDVPLQQTAGLSELEQLAQDRALADLGVAEPFVGESADLIRGTTRQFDPSMTQQFFNPFEDQVVQQTIQDVLEAGEKRDIAQRARDIQTGGLSAFGSRARLTAADRQEALGRGLAEALGGIRQAGFGQAQRDALTTFAQQRQAEQQAARDIGQVGSTLADLRARERAGLVGFGQTGRGIEETGLSRLFQQQVDAQGRPLQALQLTGSLLPQFQAGSTRIDSQYRLPTDPSAAGLGAAFNAYAALAPKQGVG